MTEYPPEVEKESDEDYQQRSSEGVNSPEIDPKTLKPTRKAITDAKQAWQVFSCLKEAQSDRNAIIAKIQDNWRGKAPYDGQPIAVWQSNFSVLFLSGIIDKVVPVLVSYIENAKYLTQSKLKDETLEGQAKTDRLRDLFTKVVRRWSGWRSFCSSLCQELVLVGYTYACRTDEFDWRPRHYRQDKAFIPEGTTQFSENVQVLAIEEDFLIHQLTEIIQDKEAAEAAKWNVDNVVESINKAMPDDRTEADDGQNQRKAIDVLQEGNLGATYSKGARVVKGAHTLAIETGDGNKVTHYIVDRENAHHELLAHESRFDSMRDIVTLFTLDPGNGCFYGSRGIGQRLVNYSVAMNGVVNDAIDALRVAGLIIIQSDISKGTQPPKVKKPFLWVNKESSIIQQKAGIAADVEAFVLLINKIGELAEVAAQQYIPNTSGPESQTGGKATAREVAIDYQREQQSVATFVARFAGQFAEMIGMMQRALCNPDTNDEDAMEFQEMALEFVSQDELTEWAESPAAEVLQDLTPQESQAKLAIANDSEVMQSPMIEQKARLEMKLGAVLPLATVKSLMKPDAIDPNDEAEQANLQIGETEDILKGNPVRVSGRHNDKVHNDVLLPDLQKGLDGIRQAVAQNPEAAEAPEIGENLDHINAGYQHAAAHNQSWRAKGATDQEMAPYEQAVDEGHKRLDQTAIALKRVRKQLEARREQAQQAMAQPGANGSAPNGAQAPQEAPKPKDPVEPADWVKMYVYDGTPDDIRRQLELKLELQPHVEEAAPAPTLPDLQTTPPQPQEAASTEQA